MKHEEKNKKGSGEVIGTDCSTFVRMFQPQFVPLVRMGKKCQTVRKTPKRLPKPGDVVSLREWVGKPYRSKQRELRRAEIKSVHQITIEQNEMLIDGVKSSSRKMDTFARSDGFKNYQDLLGWFIKTHSLPFSGIVICWSNNSVPHHRNKTLRKKPPKTF